MSSDQIKSTSEVRVRDPLSEVTRKERRNLLVSTTVIAIMLKAGLIPTKISALGVELSGSDQNAILSFGAYVTLYFLIAFIFYSASDFVGWRLEINATRLRARNLHRQGKLGDADTGENPDIGIRLSRLTRVSVPVSVIRAMLEFVFPIIYSGIVLCSVWSAS